MNNVSPIDGESVNASLANSWQILGNRLASRDW